MNEPKKPTGILWKLAPEEKAALREVCDCARAFAVDCASNEVFDYINGKINQLLGEEKLATTSRWLQRRVLTRRTISDLRWQKHATHGWRAMRGSAAGTPQSSVPLTRPSTLKIGSC